MTVHILHRSTVLVLNRHWLAIDAISPADAFGHLAADTARAMWIDGSHFQPMEWQDWSRMDIPEGAPSIGTPRGRVRIPTVIVLNRYEKVPMVQPVFGFRGIWERDGGRCQYTGRALNPNEANIDHIIPRSRGGADRWDNCVLSDRKVNTIKANRTPEEAGLKLINQPVTPSTVPSTMKIRNPWNIEDWKHFLNISIR